MKNSETLSLLCAAMGFGLLAMAVSSFTEHEKAKVEQIIDSGDKEKLKMIEAELIEPVEERLEEPKEKPEFKLFKGVE